MAGMGMIPILLCGRLAGRPWQLTSSLRASGLSAVQWARCSPCTTPHSGCSHSGCPAHLWWARPLPPARPCPDLPFDGHTFPSSLAPHTPLLPLSPSPGPSAPWLAEAPRMSLTAAFLGLDCVCPVTHPSTWDQVSGEQCRTWDGSERGSLGEGAVSTPVGAGRPGHGGCPRQGPPGEGANQPGKVQEPIAPGPPDAWAHLGMKNSVPPRPPVNGDPRFPHPSKVNSFLPGKLSYHSRKSHTGAGEGPFAHRLYCHVKRTSVTVDLETTY